MIRTTRHTLRQDLQRVPAPADYETDGALARHLRATPITVIGAGATGSYTVWLLAKSGFQHITVYDFDTVERHNLENQLYGRNAVRRKKVQALRAIIERETGIQLAIQAERFARSALRGVVCVLTDTMESRRHVWESSVRGQRAVSLYLDARAGRDLGRIYTIRPSSVRDSRGYERTLYADAEAEENPCQRRPAAPLVAVIAGLVVSALRQALQGERVPKEIICSLRPWFFTHRNF